MESLVVLFWLVCIPVRLGLSALVLWAGIVKPQLLVFIGVYAAITAVGFGVNAIRAVFGRKSRGGLGGKIWWTNVRYVHFVVWTCASVLAFLHWKYVGVVFACDAFIGALAGAIHHSNCFTRSGISP